VFAFIAVYVPIPLLQIGTFMLMTIMQIVYIVSVQPLRTRSLNRIELFNEGVTLFISYLMLLFVDDNNDTYVEYVMGWTMVFSSLLCIVINLSIMVTTIVMGMIVKIKTRRKRKRVADLKSKLAIPRNCTSDSSRITALSSKRSSPEIHSPGIRQGRMNHIKKQKQQEMEEPYLPFEMQGKDPTIDFTFYLEQ